LTEAKNFQTILLAIFSSIDSKIVLTGSYNWIAYASERNDEKLHFPLQNNKILL